MQPYPRAPDLVWPGHLHGTGCLSARAVGTGFPTVGLRLWLGPGCGWSWVLFTPARFGWGLGWVCLGSVVGVVPLLPAVCGVRGWALVSACFRDLCGFVRFSLAPRRFRFRCAVWACVLGPGLGRATPFFFLRHGGPPPKALHQSGLTMGKMSVHGEPKFSEGQPRVFTNQVRVKTLHELHHGPEKVKILVEAISVKDAKGYIAYTKAKKKKTKKNKNKKKI